MTSGFSSSILLASLLVLPLRLQAATAGDRSSSFTFSLPTLTEADITLIARRVFVNETGGEERHLTYWGEGEDFPSFGIAHFIWFPATVDAPFDETFPGMFEFVRDHGELAPAPPVWMTRLDDFDAPWSSKTEFDQQLTSPQLSEFRRWLRDTATFQVRFIVASLESRWLKAELPRDSKRALNRLLGQLVGTPDGLFAVIDYFNFKGLGDNPKERYEDSGWGLIQVLEDVVAHSTQCTSAEQLVLLFSQAAASRLRKRVSLSPPERNEIRWLDGWLRRVSAYATGNAALSLPPGSAFRITPYLQNPAHDAMTLMWFSNQEKPGTLQVWPTNGSSTDIVVARESVPVSAEALAYHAAEPVGTGGEPASIPYQHQIRINGLQPDQSYRYVVTQDGDKASGLFQTSGRPGDSVRFVVYADSETEPESTGARAQWPVSGADLDNRRYLVDQTSGYAENIKVILRRKPDFVAIAGDLVQSGGEQRDWDEFWRHNARLGASIPIIPALGNHEYFGGPGALGGYTIEASSRAVAKYKTYFDLPDTGDGPDLHSENYYRLRYGPVTLIVIDANDGLPHRSEADTNWLLKPQAQGGSAPAWTKGSVQFRWLQNTLAMAQQQSVFTFVMFHPAPYSSGNHNLPPGIGNGVDYLSAVPLRVLSPLFMRFGVDAVFSGHDEAYEHSVLAGIELSPTGTERSHQLHFFVIGIGGDGLRGPHPGVDNPHRVFLAHADAPEIRGNGVLKDGGKHYGHLEVIIEREDENHWRAQIDPVYVFPVTGSNGEIEGFERRIYDDMTILTTPDPELSNSGQRATR